VLCALTVFAASVCSRGAAHGDARPHSLTPRLSVSLHYVCVCVCVCLCLCVRAHVCCVSLNHAKSKASEHVRLLHYFTACIKVHPSHVLGNQALELHEAHRHLPPSSSWMVSMHNM
jgi:hypothetical protein